MTHWTPEQRARAIGTALSLGAKEAARQTGTPRRTISSWLARERPAPELDALIVQSRDTVAAKLWEAVTIGTEQVLAGLRDPKARLGDKATALRIVAEQYALLTGAATSRSESVNVNVNRAWETPEYQAEDPDVQRQADDLLRELLEEVMTGQAALRMAGLTEHDAMPIEVDGLAVRARLDEAGVLKVRHLLSQFEAAQVAGVTATEIIAALTTKRIGGGNVPE